MKAASLCVVAIALSLCPSVAGADKKQFTKKESGRIIEAAIRNELNKPNGEITKADLGKVTRLNLSFTKTTDASLKELAKLKNLTELGLAGTQITDSGFKKLMKLRKLTHLDLGHTKIMDAGFKMKMLTKLRKLSWLGLKDTRVTRAGVAELQKMLPKCEIISNATK
tara:strand:- start:274 stop:774 length:501 start_codon:yes stop_codon:yes gene_type:complete